MPDYRIRLALFCAISTLLACSTAHALDSREANVSLTVPEKPAVFGYQTVNAFGNLTFSQPVAIVSAPGDDNRLFIVEKPGVIQVITNLASPNKTTFLDISGPVVDGGEGGLLGLAFHPDWENNGYFYVFYTLDTTTSAGSGLHDRLSRFQIDPANTNSALVASELQLITQRDQQNNHNGGAVHFGPDGYLYVSTGDEGGGGDNYNNSRYITNDFFSAILRIDVDKQPGNLEPNSHPAVHLDGQNNAYYSVPSDNPFVGATSFNGETFSATAVRTEFWAVGLRNPWRMSFDPATGLLYCADVGQGAREEVNIIERGNDYGWRYKEGFINYQGIPAGTVEESDLTPPIIDYRRTTGAATIIPGGDAQGTSITGGVVYNGDRFPQISGYYIFGDFGSDRIFGLHYDHDTKQVEGFQQLTTASDPVGFGIDPSNGDVLIARYGGRVDRLIYSDTPVSGEELPSTLSATGAFSDLSTLDPEPGIVPYEINVPFWSDHALKSRWFSIPDVNDTMTFDELGNWSFPNGTVWIKHFDLELTNGVPESARRIETRFIVKNDDGVHGFNYKWNAQGTEADLVNELGEDEIIPIYNPDESLLRSQTWRYPARSECLQCHTPVGGYAAGFNTVQLNRQFDHGNGLENQIKTLSDVGYFESPVAGINTLPALAPADDTSVSLEYRVRSYLQANCVSCHQPGGSAQGNFDARVATPTELAGLINGDLVNEQGDPANKVVVPGDTTHSMLLQRIMTRGAGQMPPLASNELDQQGIDLLTDWISNTLPNQQTFEEYQVELFGSVENPDGAPDFDFDGDGADTFTEWLTGTDAKNAGDVWEIDIERTGIEVSIQFEQKSNRGFEVQFKETLADGGSWQVLDVPSNAPSFSNGDQPKAVSDSTAGSDSRYYRVRVFSP